jgi:uncharacterized protein YciI
MAALFVLYARDKAGKLADRMAARPKHLEHMASLGARLKVAGPILDQATGDPCGSLIIFEAENLAAAAAFAQADPYAAAGLFDQVTIAPWRAAVGAWAASA